MCASKVKEVSDQPGRRIGCAPHYFLVLVMYRCEGTGTVECSLLVTVKVHRVLVSLIRSRITVPSCLSDVGHGWTLVHFNLCCASHPLDTQAGSIGQPYEKQITLDA